jgi:TRAP-type mannitol/chloroaromatic compound transport system substrate-binding protein
MNVLSLCPVKIVAVLFLLSGYTCYASTPLPGKTTAGPMLERDTHSTLMTLDQAEDVDCKERKVANRGVVSAGPQGAVEYWMLDRCGTFVRYRITYRPDPRVGTMIGWTPGEVVGKASGVPPDLPITDIAAKDLASWDSIRSSTSPSDFEEYLRQFPTGLFAGLSNYRISELRRQSQLATVSSTGTQQIQRPDTAAPATGAMTLRAQDNFNSTDLRHRAFLDGLKEITSSTGGFIKFEPLPAGAVASVVGATEAVGKKRLDAAWIQPSFLYGSDVGFALVEGAPFGLDPENYAAWRNSKEVGQIVEKLYRRHGTVGILCGVTAPHGDIWASIRLAKPSDLKDLKLRAIGIQIPLFVKMGAAVNPLPFSETVGAMLQGWINAATFSDPSTDLWLGFPGVSKTYMIGQINGARGLDLILNAGIWDSFSPEIREAIATACKSNVRRMRLENVKLAHDAIREMQKLGVRTYPLPDSIMSALRSAWNEVRSEMVNKSPAFSDLVKSMTAYERSAQRPDLSAYGL